MLEMKFGGVSEEIIVHQLLGMKNRRQTVRCLMLIFPLLRLFGRGLDSSFFLYIYAGRMDIVQRVYAIHL